MQGLGRDDRRLWRSRLRVALLGTWTYFTFAISTLVFIPILGATALLFSRDPTRRVRGRMLRFFGRANYRLTPIWRFSVDAAAPADVRERAYVVVSNHESSADPFLLSWLPWDMRWIVKEELFRAPLIGLLIRFGGDIALGRGKRDSIARMFEECRRTLEGGMSIMLFPEGTRSKDGRLLPFKDGAFRLAIEAQVPLLPLALAGTRSCRPKGSIWFGQAVARVRVLAPIATAGMTLEDVPRLRELSRERITSGVEALRRELGEALPSGLTRS
jgi:1-acyl-sn-glycerol-3-phosphate acyltransferase